MQLARDIVINKGKDEVWSFLADPQNVAKWDRGVKAVEAAKATVPIGEGFEFTTVGHDGTAQNQGRMRYRIGQTDPEVGCRVDLVSHDGNARYSKSASWSFHVVELPAAASTKRSRIECVARFNLRLRYIWLASILFFLKGAISRDLIALKHVLENA